MTHLHPSTGRSGLAMLVLPTFLMEKLPDNVNQYIVPLYCHGLHFFYIQCSFFSISCVIILVKPQDPFEALLHHYRGLLFTLCSRFRHRGMDIDDLLQEATIALWRNRERLLALGSVQQAALTWKVARNAVIDALRRTEDADALPEGYDERDEDRSLMHELHEAIGRLEEPDRTIVRMQLEGYSYEEIGKQLEMTEKNVSVRLVRAKERLRKAMVASGE